MSDSEDDFAALLAEYDGKQKKQKRPVVGQEVTGIVLSIAAEHVFVDLGGKSEGVLAAAELLDANGKLTVKVGDSISALVVDAGERSGTITLRKVVGRSTGKGAGHPRELVEAHAHGLPVEGLVSGVNKGGFDVQIGGARGFCPVSQIDNRFVEDTAAFVGKRFLFRITRIDSSGGRDNLVLSRRALLEEEQAARAGETRARLAVGAIFKGVVTDLKKYGAFVDIGGIQGMLHVSELDHVRIEDPAEVLSVGQEVEVQVKKIEQTGDAKRPEKISLSMKSLERDPWADAARALVPGTHVVGAVVRIQPFGAFVEVAPGLEGLVHISELGAGRRVNSPREVLSVGQRVDAKILSVDPENRRLSLSIEAHNRDVANKEEAEAIAEHAPASASLGTLGDLLARGKKK